MKVTLDTQKNSELETSLESLLSTYMDKYVGFEVNEDTQEKLNKEIAAFVKRNLKIDVNAAATNGDSGKLNAEILVYFDLR